MTRMPKSRTCTDTFGFGEQSLFEEIRKSLAGDRTRTQNLIECKDDVVFAWNATDCCVLTLNWRAARSKNDGSIKFQTLLPSSPVDFTVEKITASHEGSFLALSGKRGVTILELPRRWGPNGQYKEGKDRILCSSHNLDERFFSHSPLVNVLQVRWHPDAPKDSNLLVLLSDNSIRVYDDAVLRHVWRIGAKPCAMPPTGKDVPFLNSLGDTAVDFDIGQPRVVSSKNEGNTIIDSSYSSINDSRQSINNKTQPSKNTSTIEWPLIILRGNGSIYIALIGVDSEKPRIQGPLSMYPSSEDNFGIDSCAVLALPSNPPTIVIAEPSGKIYHAIMIENDEVNEQSLNEIDATLNIYPSEWILQVLEVVELELGLPETKEAKFNYSPIFLKPDINNECRYFAYHNTGLHAVSIDFIRELELYFASESEFNDGPFLQTPAHAEYIVCTKALDNSKVNPVLGFTLLQSPSGLLVLLASGQVVSLDIITNPSYLRHLTNSASSSDSTKPQNTACHIKRLFSEPFDSHIRKMLTTGASQPILKLDNAQDISPRESLELLIYATQMLREQYILKHDKVKQEIEKRVHILKLMKEQQEQEISQLEVEKTKIKNDAERLAEQYEEANDRQQMLFKRTQEIIRLVNLKMPRGSIVEKNFATQLEKVDTVTKDLANGLAMAKKKLEKQEMQIKCQSENNKKKVPLQPRQETAIKEIITDINTQIDSQIKEIKKIKSVMNIG